VVEERIRTMTESDGIDDALESVIHMTLTGAERLGSEAARARSELLHQAGQRDQEPAQARWDTPDRRAADAQRLEAKGLPQDAVEALMRADVAQAEPAAAATRGAGRHGTTTQTHRSRGPEVQVSAPLER
jgi:hypothetical protein